MKEVYYAFALLALSSIRPKDSRPYLELRKQVLPWAIALMLGLRKMPLATYKGPTPSLPFVSIN
jgi:hypothetical protein